MIEENDINNRKDKPLFSHLFLINNLIFFIQIASQKIQCKIEDFMLQECVIIITFREMFITLLLMKKSK